METGQKIVTQKEFKQQLELMTKQQAADNIRNLASLALKAGLIDHLNKALLIDKSIDVLESKEVALNDIPTAPVSTEMALSKSEENKMIN